MLVHGHLKVAPTRRTKTPPRFFAGEGGAGGLYRGGQATRYPSLLYLIKKYTGEKYGVVGGAQGGVASKSLRIEI